MSDSAVHLQPALILQHRPYRESSLLLDVFTRDFGIVPVLAKGVRKEKSKLAGLLLPFMLLQLSYLDKRDLKILTHAEFSRSYALQRMALYCGFYVNELLQAFLHRYDPHPELFEIYLTCLLSLSSGLSIEQQLRYFELSLLEQTGYGVELNIDGRGQPVISLQSYDFSPTSGLFADAEGCISGATLISLYDRVPLHPDALQEAKQFLRKLLDVHLRGKPLKSREVLTKIIKYM
jgi:DNA repair protein RecO (recombination protein O)